MIGNRSLLWIKGVIARPLRRYPRLFAACSRLLYKFDRSFETLSPGVLSALDRAWEAAARLQGDRIGDYYEFGVFRGYALWHAQSVSRKLGLTKPHFYGFDSFQGLPEVEGIDRSSSVFFEGQFACSRSDVERNLQRNGADLSRISLIEGFFSESLTAELKLTRGMRPVALALIDCDLYSSTVDVLGWIEGLLQDGSILLFDDWRSFGDNPDLGQQKAFGEFLNRFPQWQAELFCDFQDHGRGFILRRSERLAR